MIVPHCYPTWVSKRRPHFIVTNKTVANKGAYRDRLCPVQPHLLPNCAHVVLQGIPGSVFKFLQVSVTNKRRKVDHSSYVLVRISIFQNSADIVIPWSRLKCQPTSTQMSAQTGRVPHHKVCGLTLYRHLGQHRGTLAVCHLSRSPNLGH